MAYGFNEDRSKAPISNITLLEISPYVSIDPGEGIVIESRLESISGYHPLAIIDVRTELNEAVIKGFWIGASTSGNSDEFSAYFAFENIGKSSVDDQVTAHVLYTTLIPEIRIY